MADGNEIPWTPANPYPPLPEESEEEQVARRQALARLNALYSPNLTEQQAEDAIALYPDLSYEDAILRYMMDIGGEPSGGGAGAEPAFKLTPEQQLTYSRLNADLSPNLTMAEVKAALAYYPDVPFEEALTRWADATGKEWATPDLTPAQAESARAWQLVFGGTMAEAARAVQAYEAEGVPFEEAVANQQLRDLNTTVRAISASQGVSYERAVQIVQEEAATQQVEKERTVQAEITRQEKATAAALNDAIDRQLAAAGAPPEVFDAVDRDAEAAAYQRAKGANPDLTPEQYAQQSGVVGRAADNAAAADIASGKTGAKGSRFGMSPAMAFAVHQSVQANIRGITGARSAADFARVAIEARVGQFGWGRTGQGNMARGTVGGVPVQTLAWAQYLKENQPAEYAKAVEYGWYPQLPYEGWRERPAPVPTSKPVDMTTAAYYAAIGYHPAVEKTGWHYNEVTDQYEWLEKAPATGAGELIPTNDPAWKYDTATHQLVPTPGLPRAAAAAVPPPAAPPAGAPTQPLGRSGWGYNEATGRWEYLGMPYAPPAAPAPPATAGALATIPQGTPPQAGGGGGWKYNPTTGQWEVVTRQVTPEKVNLVTPEPVVPAPAPPPPAAPPVPWEATSPLGYRRPGMEAAAPALPRPRVFGPTTIAPGIGVKVGITGLARGGTVRPGAMNIRLGQPLPSITQLGRGLAAPPKIPGMGRQLNPVGTALRLGQMKVG